MKKQKYKNSKNDSLKVKEDKIKKMSFTEDGSEVDFIFSTITIVGNDFTKISFLRNQLDVKVGEKTSIEKIERSLDNLYGLDLFSRVIYKVDNKKKGLTFYVKEKEHIVVRMGAHFMTDKGYRGFLELANRNIVGRGGITYLNYLYGDKINRVEFSYYNTMFKKSAIFYELRPFFQDKKLSIYETNKTNDDIIEKKEMRYGGVLEIGAQVYQNYLTSISIKNESVEFGNSEILRKNSFTGSLLFDTRNNSIFPTSGVLLSLNAEKAYNGYGAENEPYHKFFGNLDIYFSPFDKFTFQYKTSAGTSDNLTPFVEYFKLGERKNLPGSSFEEFYRRQFLTFSFGASYKLFSSSVIDGYFNSSGYFTGMWNNPEIEWSRSDFYGAFYTGFGLKTPAGPMELGYGAYRKIESSTVFRKAYFSFGFEL